MKNLKNQLPDKIFGIETNLILVWLGPGLLVILLLISFGAVMMPKISQVQSTFAEAQKVSLETKAVKDKTNYLLSIDQEELNNNSSLLASGILPEKNAYLLVGIIRRIANKFNYDVTEFSISLGDLKAKEEVKKTSVEYEKVPVKVVLGGPGDNFLELVTGLEKSLPVLSVDNFEMNSGGIQAEIELTVSAFYLAEGKKVKPESLGLTELTLKKEESELLSTIREYQVFGEVETETGEAKSYDREDPFFTP